MWLFLYTMEYTGNQTKLFPILEEIRTCDEKEGGQVRWLTSSKGLWKNSSQCLNGDLSLFCAVFLLLLPTSLWNSQKHLLFLLTYWGNGCVAFCHRRKYWMWPKALSRKSSNICAKLKRYSLDSIMNVLSAAFLSSK